MDHKKRAARVLGLEYLAIDYATYADGTPVLWEANPYFAMPAWHQCILARKRRIKRRHWASYDALRAFMNGLRGRKAEGKRDG